MNSRTKRMVGGFAAAGAVALIMAGAAFVPSVLQAADNPTTTPAAPTLPGGRGWHGEESSSALAEALGITVEELQAAQGAATAAAIDKAVEAGLLTEDQAATLKERGAGRFRDMDHFGAGDVDTDALLADALGISVDELTAAREKVFTDSLAQAVADGTMTEEQAQLAQADRALREYLEPKLQAAYDQALKDAVKDGIVTQEQLDSLQASGHGMRGGFLGGDFGMQGRGGHGGMRGHGGMERPGRSQSAPDSETAPDFQQEATPQGNG